MLDELKENKVRKAAYHVFYIRMLLFIFRLFSLRALSIQLIRAVLFFEIKKDWCQKKKRKIFSSSPFFVFS